MVTLGSQSFGYVLDSSVTGADEKDADKEKKPEGGFLAALAKILTGSEPETPKKAFKAVPYDRLYFDRNHNGDLTDEEPIEAQSTDTYGNRDYYATSFPRVDLTVEAGKMACRRLTGFPVLFLIFIRAPALPSVL